MYTSFFLSFFLLFLVLVTHASYISGSFVLVFLHPLNPWPVVMPSRDQVGAGLIDKIKACITFKKKKIFISLDNNFDRVNVFFTLNILFFKI